MKYLVAIFLPPLGLLNIGKPLQALLNVFLCLLFWFPGILHAVLVVHSWEADQRQQRLIEALKQQGAAQ